MKTFKDEFNRIINLLENNDSFVFVRYGDGEVALMNGDDISENTQAFVVDNWKSTGNTKLGLDLKLSLTNKDWYFGIPCKCCNEKCKNYLLTLLNLPDEKITYANLWVNSNYELFLNWVKNINDEVILIANQNAENNLNDFPFKIKEFVPMPDNCVDYYETNSESLIVSLKNIVKKHTNSLFLISAGPLSEVIIHHMYNEKKINKYVDVGSSLDEYIHKKITRPYMTVGTEYNTKICTF